jgi:hypothetical protein
MKETTIITIIMTVKECIKTITTITITTTAVITITITMIITKGRISIIIIITDKKIIKILKF